MKAFKTKAFARWADDEGLSDKAFFVYGFAKNQRANISNKELRALKLLAKELLNYPVVSLGEAMKAGELIEIKVNDNG